MLDCEKTFGSDIAGLVGGDIATELAHLAITHRNGLYFGGIWKCEGSVDANVESAEVGGVEYMAKGLWWWL